MKINVAFFVSVKEISDDIKLDNPEEGNPGIGATQYLFVLIAAKLNREYKQDLDIFFYVDKDIVIPSDLSVTVVKDEYEAVTTAKSNDIDVLVIRTVSDRELYRHIDRMEQSVVTWSHNRIWSQTANAIAKTRFVKRNICVGVRQSREFIDHALYTKTSVIHNPIVIDWDNKRAVKGPTVTFIGHLQKERGFHVLAKIWKGILKKVPNAELNVIGSAALYNRNAKLGSLGVASDKYEKKFEKYITNNNGQLLPSIKFHGIMGEEKVEVFYQTSVGVINPVGYETLGLSGIEMAACGVPLVSINKYGQSEIIKHDHTGYLFDTHKQFERYLVDLLLDTEKNDEFGINARKYAYEKFELQKILHQWFMELKSVHLNQFTAKTNEIEIALKQSEKLRIVNATLRRCKVLAWLPPSVAVKSFVRDVIHKTIKK